MRALLFLFTLALSACATAAPINTPLDHAPAPIAARAPVGDDLIILALSGGGARAASFHLGVLNGLHEMQGADGRPLTDHIALISSVSGGSVLAAYYALHGDQGLQGFADAYLGRRWPVRRQSSPLGLMGALRGGMNGPAQLADWLDANVYASAHMNALTVGPRVIINATDLYNATPFAFTPLFFEGICGNLADVRVADAVAASMAAPVAFRPVLAESYAAQCNGAAPEWTARVLEDRNAPEVVRATARAFVNYRGGAPAGQRYLLLSDGGVADNFGLSSLLVMRAAGPQPAPLTAREAVQARRILVLVVNAEYIRDRTFQTEATDAIGAYEMLYSPVDAAVDAAKRAAADAFRASLPQFEEELRQFRCGLEPRTARELGAGRGWECGDVHIAMDVLTFRDMTDREYRELYNVGTDVSLSEDVVRELIAGGQGAVTRNAAALTFSASPSGQ